MELPDFASLDSGPLLLPTSPLSLDSQGASWAAAPPVISLPDGGAPAGVQLAAPDAHNPLEFLQSAQQQSQQAQLDAMLLGAMGDPTAYAVQGGVMPPSQQQPLLLPTLVALPPSFAAGLGPHPEASSSHAATSMGEAVASQPQQAASPQALPRGRRGAATRRQARDRSAPAAAAVRRRAPRDVDSNYAPSSGSGGEGGSGSDGSDSDGGQRQSAAARRERVRAKNRLAQRRYREKQKRQAEEQQQQCEAAAAELERERLANERLRGQAAALQKIASYKQLSLGALEAALPQLPPPTRAAASPDVRELDSDGSGGGGAGAPARPPSGGPASSASTGGSSGGGAAAASRLRSLPFQQRVEVVVALSTAQQGAAVAPVAAPACHALALSQDAPGGWQLSDWSVEGVRQEVLSMREEDFVQDWAEFGELAARTVALLDGGSISEEQAAARLQPAVVYRSLLHSLVMRHQPDMYRRLLAHTHLPGEGSEAGARRWRTAAAAMRCTRQQAADLRLHYDVYCSRLARISAQSAASMRAINQLAAQAHQAQRLCDAEAPGEELAGGFLAGQSLQGMMRQYVGLFEAAKRLSTQPDDALRTLLELHSASGAVLTDMQKARCAALYRPLFPDIVAIVRACLEEHGMLRPDDMPAMGAGVRQGPPLAQ